MRKLLLLGSLLATMSLQAQTTYYWPGERATELQDQSQYFIYNTTFDYNAEQEQNKDRSYFLYSDGSNLKTNNISPKEFMTTDAAYLFKTVKPEELKADNHWYIHSAHGILSIGGQTNNTDIRDIYISKWFGNDNILKAGVKSEDENGELQMPDEVNTHVWAVTAGSEKNPNNTDNSYAWNGNAMANPGLGSAWTTWANAHPYAFYTIKSVELTEEANNDLESLQNFFRNMTPFQKQKAFGLCQEASQYSTNAQEPNEGPISNLIDGNEGTFFHSSWSKDAPNPEEPHYIQVSLNSEIKSFYFYTKKRSNSENNRPTKIKISVSSDGEVFNEVKTLTENDGLIQNNDYTSPKIEAEKSFKYIRFEVISTNSGNSGNNNGIKQPFFSYSEFYVFDGEKYDFRNNVINTRPYLETATSESIIQDWDTYKVFDIPRLLGEIQTIKNKIQAVDYGTNVNQYVKPENFDEVIAAAEKLNDKSSYEEINSVYEQITAVEAAITIVQPQPGKFYRIKNVENSKYICSDNTIESRQKLTNDGTGKNTVFFLSEGNRLTCSNFVNMNHIAPTFSGLGSSFTFGMHQVKGYVITSNGPSGNLAFMRHYDENEGDVVTTFWGDGTQNTVTRSAWILEEVTEADQQPALSKTINSDPGYATLGAPVALNIPEGVKAYTVTVNEEKKVATLNEVTGKIIPAGCGVVLEKTGGEGTYNFTFAAGTDVTIGENALVPLYTKTTVSTDINAYILANMNNGLGFYQLDPNDRTIDANKAYLELPTTMNHVRSITIGGPTTGIEETVANGNEAEEYYDLQGRRVLNPTKGIYVTKSGKKVIINK